MFLTRLYYTFFLTLLPCCLVAAQNSSTITITPFATYTQFGTTLGLNSAIGYGGALGFEAGSVIRLQLHAVVTRTDQEYDLVSDIGRIPVDVTILQLQGEYLLTRFASIADISASLAAGYMKLHTGEQRVSLGALGQVVVPEREETVVLYSAGGVMSRALSTRFAVRLEPKISLWSRSGQLQSHWSITGGISIGIL